MLPINYKMTTSSLAAPIFYVAKNWLPIVLGLLDVLQCALIFSFQNNHKFIEVTISHECIHIFKDQIKVERKARMVFLHRKGQT